MKVLEVRFHPHSKKAGAPVTIARVLCDREKAVVEPIAGEPDGIERRRAGGVEQDHVHAVTVEIVDDARDRIVRDAWTAEAEARRDPRVVRIDPGRRER